MESKKPWLSKTLWVNLFVAVLVFVWPTAAEYVQAHPETVAIVFSGVNIVLRLVTKSGIEIV